MSSRASLLLAYSSVPDWVASASSVGRVAEYHVDTHSVGYDVLASSTLSGASVHGLAGSVAKWYIIIILSSNEEDNEATDRTGLHRLKVRFISMLMQPYSLPLVGWELAS